MFRSFFCDTRRAWIAYGGAFLLVMLMVLHVGTSYLYAEMMNVFGEVLQRGAESDSVHQYLHTIVYYAGTFVPLLSVDTANRFISDQSITLTGLYGIVMYGFIPVPILYWILNNGIQYASDRYVWYWREAITMHYIQRWNVRSAKLEGSSQRIHEAANNFASSMLDICRPIVRSALALFAFVPMLWALSKEFENYCHVPGILLWTAILFSVFGTLVSLRVGRRLPQCECVVQQNEGHFRSKLESINRGRSGGTIYDTATLFENLSTSCKRLHRQRLKFNLWLVFYQHVWEYIPLFLLGFLVVIGVTSFGVMMQTRNALGEAKGALSVFSDTMPIWTRLNSFVQRLNELEQTFEPNQVKELEALDYQI